MTTYASFVTALTGMTVSGMKNMYATPISKADTAQLPCLFPMTLLGESRMAIQGGSAHHNVRTVPLVVLMNPVGASNLAQDFSATQTMLDALDAALKTLESTANYDLAWAADVGVFDLAGQPFRAISLEVTMGEVD